MARTIQKRIKFSKGQIDPDLVERTDLGLYNSSAQKMKNFVSEIYGGVRSRRGTKYVDDVVVGTPLTPSSITSNYFSGDLTDDTVVKESPVLTNSCALIEIDFGSAVAEGISLVGMKIKDEPVYEKIGAGDYSLNIDGTYRVKMIASCGKNKVYKKESGGTTSVYAATGGAGGSTSFLFNAIDVPLDYYVIKLLSSPESILTPGGETVTLQPGVYLSETRFIQQGEYYFYCSPGENATATSSSALGGLPGTVSTDHLDYRENQFTYIDKEGNTGGSSTEYPNVSGDDRIYIQKAGSCMDKYGTNYATYPVDALVSELPSGESEGNLSTPKFTLTPEMDIPITVYGQETLNSSPVYLGMVYVNKNSTDLSLSWNGKYRYIYVDYGYLEGGQQKNYYSKLEIRKVVGVKRQGSQNYGRMYSFVYNNDQKYLLLFSAGSIKIYEDDEVIQTIWYEDITDDILKEMDVAYKDDTIIFTHEDLRTKQLQRQSNGQWALSDFEFKNIPTYCFNGETETEYNLRISPSGTEGVIKMSILDGEEIVDETWVGQIFDGGGGRAKITGYVDNRTFECNTIIPFYTTDTIEKWKIIRGYEPVWSATRGYPSTCLFAQQRLWFGGSKSLPSHIWASRIDDYNNFKNAANSDNDAIDVTMLTNEKIINIVECRGIHVFTSGDEWTAAETSLTPDMFSISKNSSNGSYPGLEAIVLNDVICYVEKNGRSLLSYVYNYEQASYQSDNLSIMTNLIEAPARIGCVMNSSVDKGDFLYVVKKDGTMLIACVSIPQHIFSVSEYVTDGQIKDVCTLGDDIYLIVKRGTYVFLEKVASTKVDHACDLVVDDPTNITTTHLEFFGKPLYIYNNNIEVGPCSITSGGLVLVGMTLPVGGYTMGIAYDYELESNPININGKTTNIKKRISHATLTCRDTNVLEFCGQKKYEKEDVFDFYSCTKYENDVRFNVKGTFYPINILSVLLNINYEGGRDEQ